jgi:hypothetical protein
VDLREARDLARRAFWLLLSRYTGSMTEEERRRALKGLEHLFPEEFPGELEERLEEEGRLRWAVEKAFIPPPWFKPLREGAETPRRGQSRDNRKRKELKVRISASPSLFSQLCALAYRLAERGYVSKLKVIRVRDLKAVSLLPPFLLAPFGDRAVRLELVVCKPSPS